ncbi:uracil-DNA glycosylase [Pyxidicoccus parkwayensis]|uniref:Type-4 uracil-DNA glycosylase n=1 Tax=Pyxidicoccus parkwayensis TaxID=2813578 RepID=A0ABX7P4A8_9BACT|nr:uracil-DNA glycosylase [Pyxidicoccus parkwaysis]QSQ25281.1 uracil-DNA glycosylase [Pyxidicoccus parkwaysis]
MNDDLPDSSQELSAVLDEVRRHLLWQEEAAGRVLMVDAKAAAELQRSAPSLRSLLSRGNGTPEAAPARPAPAAVPRPSAVSTPVASVPRQASGPVGRTAPSVGASNSHAGTPMSSTGAPSGHPGAPSRPAATGPTAPPPSARAPASHPTLVGGAGMLLDVPQQAPRYAGPLPGTGDGGRPTLDEIRRELGDCQRCKLCRTRKNIVFGSGNPRAELVFVGEGPGENEDLQGVPFVGAAGELLTKMIEAMGFRRDDVYICNVVKCRPPGNRNPEPDEIAACEPFLRAQLAAIQPKVVVALGKFAAQTLLRDSTPITRMRGNWRTYEGIQLMPTFHPAYLLRSPAEKRKAWEDLQAVMKVLGKQPPGSRA